jgi:hypothetical protein
MKSFLLFSLLAFFATSSFAQPGSVKEVKPDSTKKIMIVDASCGECQFHMAGKGCDLAVRINGKTYFVDGTSINDHGDAHANDGFCEAIRKAKVQGEIVDNRFKATYFKLISKEEKTESQSH